MIRKISRSKAKQKRHYRLRRYLKGSTSRPRLAVFRSNKHIYAQIIDDTAGNTLVAASTMEKALIDEYKLKSTSNLEAAQAVGKAIAKKAINSGITSVVFDRGGYIYHGKVKMLAEAARETGLVF